MTPRSRKPVIINCDPPTNIPCHISSNQSISSESSNSVYDSSASSMKNDSDFVSTDESCPSSSFYIKYKKMDETKENNTSKDKSSSSNDNFTSLSGSALSERRKKILQERNYHKLIDTKNPGCQVYNVVNQSKTKLIEEKLYEESDSQCSPNLSLMNQNDISLTDPFRQYLQYRSVLTGSPVDLSFTSGPEDYCENLSEGKMTDSLLYCMDGNVPPDLTAESDFNCSDKEALIRKNHFPVNVEGASINKSKISNSNQDPSMKKLKILQRYDGFVSNTGLVFEPTDKENVSPANKRTAQSLDQDATEIKKGNITNDSDKQSKEIDKSTILNEDLTGNPDFWDYSKYGPIWETNL